MGMWVDNYRPREFEDVIGQAKIIDRIKAFVENKNMPHLMFSGPAGVGKTTTSLIIAKKLFGDTWNQNFLELNASDERGIQVVREKIKDFARTRSLGNVPFKIIFLDECDSLTKDAQQALRRTMENYSNTCRFILSCNYSSKIIDPIQSRCTIFRFKNLDKESLTEIIKKISENEKLNLSEDVFEALYEVSRGDVRKASNVLQSCASVSKNITSELVYETSNSAKPKEVLEVLNLSLNGEFLRSRDLLLDVMLKHGLSGLDLVKQIQLEIGSLELDEKLKAKMIEKTGEIEFRMVEGSDEYVQLEALLASFSLIK